MTNFVVEHRSLVIFRLQNVPEASSSLITGSRLVMARGLSACLGGVAFRKLLVLSGQDESNDHSEDCDEKCDCCRASSTRDVARPVRGGTTER